MRNNKKIFGLALLCPLLINLGPVNAAPTPADQDKLRLKTSTPKKDGETLLSYTVTWRIDDGLTNRSTGITFIQGPDKRNHTTDVKAAKKLVTALNDAMEYLYPSWRGALVEQPKDQPEITVSNKQGFDITEMTFRDYSNQELSYDAFGESFAGKQIDIALDIVNAADVEQVKGFTTKIDRKFSGGVIEVSIDGGKKVSIDTDGKKPSQIENELAQALGSTGTFSSSPIFPNLKDGSTRNFKPFDGGEVQLMHLPAKSITINVNDPNLGILTKFSFPDYKKPTDVASRLPYAIFIGAIAVFGYFFFNWYRQSRKEDEDGADT